MSDPHSIRRYCITGANGYLGKCLAQYLSKHPRNRVLTTSRGAGVFDALPPPPNRQHIPGVDLLNPDDMSRFAAAVLHWADGPFHVINCVGYFTEYRAICETPVDEARRIFESNVLALYSTAKTLLPIMGSNGGGHFIAFSTHAVTESYPLMAAFTAAKAAVDSLVQSIANEHSKDRIIANALAIATLNSPRERSLRPSADNSDWLQVEQIVQFVEHTMQTPFGIMNGNTIHLFNYSDSFFHQSYFDRLGIAKPLSHPLKSEE